MGEQSIEGETIVLANYAANVRYLPVVGLGISVKLLAPHSCSARSQRERHRRVSPQLGRRISFLAQVPGSHRHGDATPGLQSGRS